MAMMKSRLIYYLCVCIYSGMMGANGYDIKSWSFWIGLAAIFISNVCGMFSGED